MLVSTAWKHLIDLMIRMVPAMLALVTAVSIVTSGVLRLQ